MQRYFHYLPSHICTWKEKLDSMGLSLNALSTSSMENKQKGLRYIKNNASNSKQNFMKQVLQKEARILMAMKLGLVEVFKSDKDDRQEQLHTKHRRARQAYKHRCLFDLPGGLPQDWLPPLIDAVKSQLATQIPEEQFDDVMNWLAACPLCKDVAEQPPLVRKRRLRRSHVARVVNIDADQSSHADHDSSDDSDFDEARAMSIDDADSDTDDSDFDVDDDDDDDDG